MNRRGFGARAAIALAWPLGPARAVDPGQAAPDVELPDCTVARRLSDLRGRWVYLDFWASWCTPCRQSFPWMNELQASFANHGLLVLAINLDTRRADADAFLARTPARFALAFDPRGESARRFAIKGMPSSALVDPAGRLRFAHRGFRLEDRSDLWAQVRAAMNVRD